VNIDYTGQNIEVTEAIKTYTQKKLNKLVKHSSHIESINVIFHVENRDHIAKATIHLPKIDLFAHHSSEDLYKSIDFLANKLLAQLDKHNSIIHEKHDKHDKHNNDE
jgi:putative sigma-54 modulation protein